MDHQFKVSIIRTEFFTNVDKKTVTCKLYYRIKPSNYRMACILNSVSKFISDNMYAGNIYTSVATAKTLPKDTFDQHKGEQIARAKAESMAYSRVSTFFMRFHNWYVENFSTPMVDFVEKSLEVTSHNNRYIESF